MTEAYERKYIEFVGRQQDLDLQGRFNTFRRGTKWLDALRIGEVVGLHVVDRENEFEGDVGVAVVTELHSDKLARLLNDHIAFNHGVMWSGQSPDTLLAILAGVYGADAVGDREIYTAVYLTRILLTPADDLLLELTARMHQQNEVDSGLTEREELIGAAAGLMRIVRDSDEPSSECGL